MELYYWPMSHNARKVRSCAKYLGLEIQEKQLSMQDKEHKADSFLAINPMGEVPALKDGDYTVWQANAILVYLATQVETDLSGQSSKEWASITQWMLWQTAELSAVVQTLHVENYFKRVRGIDADDQKKHDALSRLQYLLTILNDEIDEDGYLVAGRLTIADFAVAGDFTHAENAQFPIQDYPNVSKWLNNIQTLSAWLDTAPPSIG